MVVETVITSFINLVQVAPMAAAGALGVGAATLAGLKSVYFAILAFFVSFGILLTVL